MWRSLKRVRGDKGGKGVKKTVKLTKKKKIKKEAVGTLSNHLKYFLKIVKTLLNIFVDITNVQNWGLQMIASFSVACLSLISVPILVCLVGFVFSRQGFSM